MPPKKEKEAIVLLLDVGKNAAISDESGKTFLDTSKECISLIVQKKLFTSSADEFGLIVFGCKETNNCLANEDDGGYENINVVTHLCLPKWDLLKYVEDLTSSSFTTDWLDAIIVGIQYLRDETEGKDFVQKKLVIFSNFVGQVSDDQVDVVIDGIKNLNINLIVIGPNLLRDNGMDCKKKHELQRTHDDLILKIITEINGERDVGSCGSYNGIICSFEDAIPELMYFQRKNIRPTPWNSELIISSNIKILITGYKKVADIQPIKWLSESIDDENAFIMTEQAYVKFDAEKGLELEVDKSDVIDAYQFGETLIPFSDVEKEVMTYKSGKKGLYLIGCTREENVPLYILLGTGNYVITNRKDDKVGKLAFESFVTALYEESKVGIAKKIYSDNSTAVLVTLFPVVNDEYKYLVSAELPYAQDGCIYKFPTLTKIPARTSEQSEAVSDLIDSMDLDETDEQCEKYDPAKTYSPNEQFLYQCITFKALHPEQTLPDNMFDIINHMVKPLPAITQKSKPFVEKVKTLFPLQKVIVESKRKKRGMGERNEDLADVKEDEVIEKVGTRDPVNDFQVILNQGTLHIDVKRDIFIFARPGFEYVACGQLQDVIVKLLALLPDDISKPLSALGALRKSCVSLNPKVYNSWMFQFKEFLQERNINTFWNAIVNEKLGLITKVESEESDISLEDSGQFLGNKLTIPTISNDVDMNDSADDLWNEL